LIDSIKEILEREKIHQVGSFVRTYFEQVGRSFDPCKQEISNLLSSRYIKKRFNSDPRKYSRFYETSQFSSKLNIGGHAESAMIFTPDGYLPRQGFINLTIDAFGSSINLLEIGARAEGTEKLFDDLLGPNGYFTNPTGYFFKRTPKPHSNPKIVELQEKFSKGIKKNPNLDLSFYLRIFGDEIAYKNIRNVNLIEKFYTSMAQVTSAFKTGKEAKVNLARANQLINHYLSIPTISGLPLHVAVNLTVALKLDFNGKADFSKIKTESKAEIRASLKPSAAIQNEWSIAIHAGQSKFGVRSIEVLHTSTAANIILEKN